MKTLELSLLALKNNPNLTQELSSLKNKGITQVHYDVMDGKFVPNTAFFGENISTINSLNMKLSVHLMVLDIDYYVDKFLKYKIDYLSFHIEQQTPKKIIDNLVKIKKNNILAGIAIKPKTDIDVINEYLKYLDFVTVMSVEPGFGGQTFIPEIYDKILLIRKNFPNLKIQIDGGINQDNIYKISPHVDFIVSGTFFSKYNNLDEVIEKVNKEI